MHKNVEKSCDMSLENMGLEYIDLLLIHCNLPEERVSAEKW